MNSTSFSNATGLFDRKLQLVEQIILASIFICALIGNILVLIIMIKKRHQHMTRMAFFILNLTIADLLVAFFSVLPMLIWKSTITFLGPDWLCRFVSFMMLTVTYISVYTLVVMAFDRYLAIVHPLSTYTWTYQSGLTHMFGVWCVSLVLASPQLIIFRLDHHPAYKKKTCMAKFLGADRTWELVYICWTIFFQFLLPVCILIFCYTSVYIIINRNYWMHYSSDNIKTINLTHLPRISLGKRTNTTPTTPTTLDGENANPVHFHFPSIRSSGVTTVTLFNRPTSSHTTIRDIMYPVVYRLRRSHFELRNNLSTNSIEGQKSRQRHGANHFLSRARLKTIKLTFIVVLTYIICSTPFYIGSIIMVLHEKFISQKIMNWLMTIFSLLFNLNSCSNPVICLILSGTLLRHHHDPRKSAPVPSQSTAKTQQRKIFSLPFAKPFVSLKTVNIV